MLFWIYLSIFFVNWYVRNVIICKRFICFVLGLYNINEWYELIEVIKIVFVVFLFYVGNLILLLRFFY